MGKSNASVCIKNNGVINLIKIDEKTKERNIHYILLPTITNYYRSNMATLRSTLAYTVCNEYVSY